MYLLNQAAESILGYTKIQFGISAAWPALAIVFNQSPREHRIHRFSQTNTKHQFKNAKTKVCLCVKKINLIKQYRSDHTGYQVQGTANKVF